MNKEEIDKLFRRIELDKLSDSCGFEFADSFSCTFDNIATCYDDRLKLYDLAKYHQNNLKKLKQENDILRENYKMVLKMWKDIKDENKQLKSTLDEII